MSVKWGVPTFTCHACGRSELGRENAKHNEIGTTPSVHGSQPPHWLRTYGFDLCPFCNRELALRVRVAREFNTAIYKVLRPEGGKMVATHEVDKQILQLVTNELWKHCRIHTYPSMLEYIQETRKKSGLHPDACIDTYVKAAKAWKVERAKGSGYTTGMAKAPDPKFGCGHLDEAYAFADCPTAVERCFVNAGEESTLTVE